MTGHNSAENTAGIKQAVKRSATSTRTVAWRALHVNSRSEKKVMISLLGLGIEAYVPLVRTVRQWSDRKKKIEVPMMHGYVFVRASDLDFDEVVRTKGVVRFVRSAGKIAPVRDVEISRRKQLADLGCASEAGAIAKNYYEGDRVRITSGPLSGIEGYLGHAGSSRVLEVLLESIGQCVRVRVPSAVVESIKTQ